jgi:hypothetical protein
LNSKCTEREKRDQERRVMGMLTPTPFTGERVQAYAIFVPEWMRKRFGRNCESHHV